MSNKNEMSIVLHLEVEVTSSEASCLEETSPKATSYLGAASYNAPEATWPKGRLNQPSP